MSEHLGATVKTCFYLRNLSKLYAISNQSANVNHHLLRSFKFRLLQLCFLGPSRLSAEPPPACPILRCMHCFRGEKVCTNPSSKIFTGCQSNSGLTSNFSHSSTPVFTKLLFNIFLNSSHFTPLLMLSGHGRYSRFSR